MTKWGLKNIYPAFNYLIILPWESIKGNGAFTIEWPYLYEAVEN